ncbi:hypothetical protein [Lysobacter enzymogenes]|uniref:hypothetical protein n=1 Tax=Lysobacter enzymogenes TaxID=69 RepID=UPI0009D374EE|nr:hypothetical protein [Lysobacter enzymogenes]UZW62448.1 hypothetical protein BV903_009210 [Lysobacter enzymogenes]
MIRFPGGETRIATFFTLANVASLVASRSTTGESLSGSCFWARDMVILKNLRIEPIEAAVVDIARRDEHRWASGCTGADGVGNAQIEVS